MVNKALASLRLVVATLLVVCGVLLIWRMAASERTSPVDLNPLTTAKKSNTPSWFKDVDPSQAWVESKRAETNPGGGPTPDILEQVQELRTPFPQNWSRMVERRSGGVTAEPIRVIPIRDFALGQAVGGALDGRDGNRYPPRSPNLTLMPFPDEPPISTPADHPQVWHQDAAHPTVARVYLGDKNSLELVSLQISVNIDGPRARTVVDHIFHNPHDRQLEGTFEYPLPTGASPSYFAMFLGQTRDTVPERFARGGTGPLPAETLVSMPPAQMVKHVSSEDWGTLQEAKIVAKEKGLETYEEVTRRRIDPALLEYAGGNTFSGRVFPIPAKGYNRVILAYEETLPIVSGRATYRFALPDCKLNDLSFTVQGDTDRCPNAKFTPDADHTSVGSRTYINKTWKDKGPGGDALFTFKPPQADLQAITGRDGDEGPIHLYARLRPDLKVTENKPFADRAVFLLDTSLSEHPDRFEINMKLLKRILESDPDIKYFNILTFNVGTAWVEHNGWLPNTSVGRNKAFNRLEGLVLEGATDISAALNALLARSASEESSANGPTLTRSASEVVFLLSDGQPTWGNRDTATLVSHFEQHCKLPVRFNCYRIGLGAENQELFEALTHNGGNIVQCHSEEEIAAAGVAHRHHCLQISDIRIEGDPKASDLMIAGRQAAVYPGGEVIIAARLDRTGDAKIVLEGTYQGKQVHQEYSLTVDTSSMLAPRAWAEVAVASLSALNDPKLDSVITAYCQRYGIGSRYASFLVLENEAEYKRYNLDDNGDKTVTGDLGKFLSNAWKSAGCELTPRAEFEHFLSRVGPHVHLADGPDHAHLDKLLTTLSDRDFELPWATINGALLRKRAVPQQYLTALGDRDRPVSPFLDEAQRRLEAEDTDGALRALSSVIELYPTRGDALRLVGYRLLDMHQPAHAVQLFHQVQRDRPFEPHSYRDLARSLEDCGKYGLAALQYEIALAGDWHNRFHESLKTVLREEYTHMMREAIRQKALTGKLADVFGERLESLAADIKPSDLRVTITWNSDNTDVDLWVLEPDGTKCFYQNRKTPNGGELSEDCTQGYGPERFQAEKAVEGEYRIAVNYYAANPNLVAGETHVQVIITRHAGTPDEESVRRTVVLKKGKDTIEVGRVKF
jgi:hypothetical protein